MQISEPRFVRMATTCQLRDSSADAHNVMLSCLECHMCGDRTCFVTTGMPQNVRMENPGDAASTRTCNNLDAKRSEGASGGGKDLSHRPSQVPSTMKTSYHRPSRRVPSTEWTPDPSTKQGAANEEDAIPIDQSGCHPRRGRHTIDHRPDAGRQPRRRRHTIDQVPGAHHEEDAIPSTRCGVPTKKAPYHGSIKVSSA